MWGSEESVTMWVWGSGRKGDSAMEGDRQGYAVTLDFHMASRPYPIMYVHTSPHPHGHTCHPHRDGHQVVVAKPLAAVIGTIACAPAAAISTGHCAVKAVIRFARVGVQVGVRPEGALAVDAHAVGGVAGELKRLHAGHLQNMKVGGVHR